jgi:ATP-dependent Lhr-like helicase
LYLIEKVFLEKKDLYQWFDSLGWEVFPFQQESWDAVLAGKSGIVNAPTGSGKTYSLLLPSIVRASNNQKAGVKVIWLTPLKALSKEIYQSAQRAVEGLKLEWKVGVRTGDTSIQERKKHKSHPPDILITTPESLHLLLTQKENEEYFKHLTSLIVDEWHELMGSKRGVQVQLALSFLMNRTDTIAWGISATIGNLSDAVDVLLGTMVKSDARCLIRANIHKNVEVHTVLPDEIEHFPWAGHLGIKLLDKVLSIIKSSKSCLIFTNTRAQCEIWYQRLLEIDPDLAGIMAMHHGSISRDLREWVEESLHEGDLQAVVCTSSLDLGVDFRPVETIVQIGSPKGVARFLQRAGRSGHQPGADSRIYFVPTHSLELIEGAALRAAIKESYIEDRIPYILSFDVLIQYMMTLASGSGFQPDQVFDEVSQTFCYQALTRDECEWCIRFLIYGGKGLQAYSNFRKVGMDAAGIVRVLDKSIAMRHRLSIGTIVGDAAILVKYMNGKKIGTIEEWFISQLEKGDTFWFAGRSLSLVRLNANEALVKNSKKKTGRIPSWMGGRMPLSSQMSSMIRSMIDRFRYGDITEPEIEKMVPLLMVQDQRSFVPSDLDFLIEYFEDKEGYHLLLYPFEGRAVHEGLGALIGHRLSQYSPISFSIAMNDYGLELLSDQPIPIEKALENSLFHDDGLSAEIQKSINEVEMAKRQFRDISSISGMIFKGYPGKNKKEKHLITSTSLLFDVFQQYDPDNLLYLQSFDEVKTFQLEESRLRAALQRIQKQEIRLMKPERATPFAFPIIVDRLRERMSTETLEQRIQKMKTQLEA